MYQLSCRLTATGQHLCAERAVIECRFTKAPEPCPKCGAAGASRGTTDQKPATVQQKLSTDNLNTCEVLF